MAKKAAASRTPRRRKRVEPRSRGLTPAACREEAAAALEPLARNIEGHGGIVLASYRDPLGGHPTALAILPIDKVAPTPFQRDLSEAHAKRLAETIGRLGRFLDPIVAVPSGEGFLTPNGRHRLEAMTRLGARSVTALVLPEAELQYKILALNVEKAHGLREKSLEVIRMYRALAPTEASLESARVLEFEEPAFATLGICYERNGRFGGGAYQPILKRVDGWLEKPLAKALEIREERAAKLERLDARVLEAVRVLQARSFKSPYLKAFVVARVNPLRFVKTAPSFDEALDDILERAARFNPSKVRQEDIAASAAPVEG